MNAQKAGAAPGRKVGLYGCGVIAPGAANLKEFMRVVERQEPVLEPEARLGNMFLVGKPKFSFESCREWISSRHNPSRFSQLSDKGGENVQFGVGSAIDALQSNPGLEAALRELNPRVIVCYGSGFSDLEAQFYGEDQFKTSSKKWNRFWADPVRNFTCKAHLEGRSVLSDAPKNPREFEPDSFERTDAFLKWDEFWAEKSNVLKEFNAEFRAIEETTIGSDVAADKLNVIRAKAKARKTLLEKYGCPVPPWDAVNPNFLWNLPNAPAAQVSMLLGIHGVSYSSIGACATFGLVLRQALDSIRAGHCDAAIIGTTDLSPPPAKVAAFHSAKVLAVGNQVGTPLCSMRGTHVAGGACTWIVAADDVMEKLGVKSLGVELVSVGLSSDAEHIITPSFDGPKLSIREAFRLGGASPADICTWDMHATGTPGDWSEFKLMEDFVPKEAVITARKGIFGHGMATCGGWELTAQVFSFKKTSATQATVLPSGIPQSSIHPTIASLGRNIACDKPLAVTSSGSTYLCGKLSMGIGGISACVLTRVTL